MRTFHRLSVTMYFLENMGFSKFLLLMNIKDTFFNTNALYTKTHTKLL